MSNIEEDMAETFSHIIASDEELPEEYETERVKDKMNFLIDWLEDNFEGVTEDAYWYKWVE